MKQIKTIIAMIFLLGALFLSSFSIAKADGAIIPHPGNNAYEQSQKAVVMYENGLETLIVSTSFQSDSKDFAWIIPVPTEPKVTKSSNAIFTGLEQLTKASTNPNQGVQVLKNFGISETLNQAVEVIEQKKVGPYDVVTLQSSDSLALANWLNQNNYNISPEATGIFDDYINKNWFFVAAKIDPSQISDTLNAKLVNGDITPLKLTFKTDKMIFPFKVSGTTLDQTAETTPTPSVQPDQNTTTMYSVPETKSMDITLYLLADHRQALPGFDALYANWQSQDEIQKLATDQDGNPALSPDSQRLFLTKLNRSMTLSEIENDLYPQNSANNDLVGVKSENNFFINIIASILIFIAIFLVTALSPLGLIFIIAAIIQFFGSSKVARLVSLIFQILVILIYLAIVGLIILTLNSSINWQFTVGIISGMIVIALMIMVLIYQNRFQKNKDRAIKTEPVEEVGETIFQDKKKNKKKKE